MGNTLGATVIGGTDGGGALGNCELGGVVTGELLGTSMETLVVE